MWTHADRDQSWLELLYTHQGAPSGPAVQEGIGREGLQADLRVGLQVACRLVAERANHPVVSQRCPVAGRGMAASPEAGGRRACAVVGRAACSGARHQGLGAFRLAEERAAFRLVAWALSKG